MIQGKGAGAARDMLSSSVDASSTAGPVMAPGDGAAAAAAKAAAGMDETSPSSTAPPFSIGPFIKDSDGGGDY